MRKQVKDFFRNPRQTIIGIALMRMQVNDFLRKSQTRDAQAGWRIIREIGGNKEKGGFFMLLCIVKAPCMA